jgi:hypothetical protein
MMAKTVLVRTDLTEQEWKALRKAAIDKNQRISAFAGNALRRAIPKGVKP